MHLITLFINSLQNRAIDCIHAHGGLFESARKHQPRENTQEAAAARATEFARVKREREAINRERLARVRARAAVAAAAEAAQQ